MEKNIYSKLCSKFFQIIIIAHGLFLCNSCYQPANTKLVSLGNPDNPITILFLGYYSNNEVNVTSGDILVYQGRIKGNDSIASGGSRLVNVFSDKDIVVGILHQKHHYTKAISFSRENTILSVNFRNNSKRDLYLEWLREFPRLD